MKTKVFISTIIIFFLILGSNIFLSDKGREKIINYNGNDLRVSIDGASSATLPSSGNYYLVNYICGKNTKVTWNNTNHKLNITNGNNKGRVACHLTFKSQPKLSEMPVGGYVSYEGTGGKVGSTSVVCKKGGSASSSTASAATEAPNSCLGQNAREDLDTSGYTYGYCYDANYKYVTTGWRVGYIKDGKAMLVSAGSPECLSRTNSTANETYIKTANAKAMKYCNSNYVDGDCTCIDGDSDGLCDSPSTDVWALGDEDFYYMTKAISGYGKRLVSGSSSLGDVGGSLGSTLYCYNQYSRKECGYNNDLIDNGGYYWFAARYSASRTDGVYWYPNSRYVDSSSYANAYGSRFVISLKSSVYVTGGEGTMDNPYTIGVE